MPKSYWTKIQTPNGLKYFRADEVTDELLQKIKDAANDVFYVEYGTTTFADAEAAYLAGKTLICREIGQTVQQTRIDDLYLLIDYMPTAGTYTGHFVFSNINGYVQDRVLLTPSAHYEKISTTLTTREQVMATASAEIAPEYDDLCQEYVTDNKFPIPIGTVVTYIDNTSSDELQYLYKSKVEIAGNEWASSSPLQAPEKWDKVRVSDIMSSLFYADICITPFDDIKAAYDRGDVIVGRSGSDIYQLYRANLGGSSGSFSFASLHGNVWYLWTCHQNAAWYEATNGWATPPGMVLFPERKNIADDYNNQRTYAVGDLCYNGNLYRCTTAIDVPENWNASHWTQTSMNAELSRLIKTFEYEPEYGVSPAVWPDGESVETAIGNGCIVRIRKFSRGGTSMYIYSHTNNAGNEHEFVSEDGLSRIVLHREILDDTYSWVEEASDVPRKQSIAPEYDSESTYDVGDLVYNGLLYRCTTAISTPEAWTPAHWTQTTAEDELKRVESSSKIAVFECHYDYEAQGYAYPAYEELNAARFAGKLPVIVEINPAGVRTYYVGTFLGGNSAEVRFHFVDAETGAMLKLEGQTSNLVWSSSSTDGIKNWGDMDESDLVNGVLAIDGGNSLTNLTLTTVQTLTVLANDGVPNFVLEIDNTGNSNAVAVTVKDSTGAITLKASATDGDTAAAGKYYQLTCVGSCWTLTEFTPPAP